MKQDWKAVGSYGTVGLEMVLSILVGLFIGRWLDAKLGTDPYLSVLWFFFGVGAAGKAVFRAWKDMQAVAAREEREQGNPAPRYDDRKARQDDRATDDDRRTGSSDEGLEPDGRQGAKENDER
ncbi:AtpZ/AtpI family protein [Sorangium sp. So ce1000]|uniref:AtpZ/AtpI family protein n=1 Tax=Sorangium sp. So ce1000 TaxID=3133325 RepID=UPI003F5E080D